MSKAADMAKVSAKGGFHLLWGLVLSTVISSVGTIFIARLLGSDQYGLYSIVLIAPNLILIFRDWGVNSAMIRFTAQFRAEGRIDEVRSIIISGIIFEIALGLALSLTCFLMSGFLATTVFHRPTIAPLIQIASFFIFAGGLINAATAAFTGLERMELNSIMLIFQSIIKTVTIIVLVAFGLGTAGATIGFTASMLMAGLVGIILMSTLYRKLPKPITYKLEVKAYITTMLQYCLPISFSAIIGGFLTHYYAFLLPVYYATDNVAIGNYGIAANFVVLISFFAVPITTMLFPAFSKLDPQKDKQTLQNVFQFSVKYASLLVVPVTALVMSLSEPAISTLFGNTYNSAPLFLALLAISYFYTIFGNLSIINLLNSQGQTQYVLKLSILTAAIGFPMSYALIMTYGVIGLIATALTANIPTLILGLRFIRKHYDLTVYWKSSAQILSSSVLTGTVTYFVVSTLHFASWIRLIIGVGVFILVLLPTILLTRALTRQDMINLRNMTSSIGFVGKLLNKILSLVEKISTTLKIN
jgi:O-antigen/teichoic acid export membrane protein